MAKSWQMQSEGVSDSLGEELVVKRDENASGPVEGSAGLTMGVSAASAGPSSAFGVMDFQENHSEYVNAAIAYLATLRSAPSRRCVRSRLDVFARWLGRTDAASCEWEHLRYVHVVGFVHYLTDVRGISEVSANAYLSAVKGVVESAWRLRQIDMQTRSEIQAIRQLRVYREPTGRALEKEESAKLLEAVNPERIKLEATDPEKKSLPGEAVKDTRDEAVLALLLGCGLRRAEVAQITMENLNMEAGKIRVLGKGNKERFAYLTSEVKARIHAWLAVRGADPGWLFSRIRRGGHIELTNPLDPASVGRIVDNARKKSGIERITTHDLRRTFATRLLEKNVDIVAVKNLMGHANVTTTAKYDRRVAKALQCAAMEAEL